MEVKPMKSMTGYGRGEVVANGQRLIVEIRSVNHRYRDISVHLPKHWLAYEQPVRKELQAYFFRGKVDVYVQREPVDGLVSTLNWERTEQWIHLLRTLKERYQLAGDIDVKTVLLLPDLWQTDVPEDVDWSRPLLEALTEACRQWDEMRRREGALIQKELCARNARVVEYVQQMQQESGRLLERYRRRLQERLHALGVDIPEEKLHAELLLFAEKANVDEELSRLQSHCWQFARIVEEMGANGKKLDFLLQEMSREIHTISAKVPDPTLNPLILATKDEIDKMREQIQNVE
ncbi:MAG: YicC family protein [Bacillaceae bacterium G1]|nr:YicC family protein [Bacillota bacterium]OJF17451.1 MAG: YicC family protein [Bacillaceae bacterium G1]